MVPVRRGLHRPLEGGRVCQLTGPQVSGARQHGVANRSCDHRENAQSGACCVLDRGWLTRHYAADTPFVCWPLLGVRCTVPACPIARCRRRHANGVFHGPLVVVLFRMRLGSGGERPETGSATGARRALRRLATSFAPQTCLGWPIRGPKGRETVRPKHPTTHSPPGPVSFWVELALIVPEAVGPGRGAI